MITTFTYSLTGATESGQANTFASINGKTYHIVRGYKLNDREIWLQIAGTTALRSSDLGANWEVAGSRGIHLAYVNRYFHYQSERADLQLAFVGNTTAGSRFLALWFMKRRFGFSYSDDELARLALFDHKNWKSFRYGTSYLEDFASQDPNKHAVLVDFPSFINQDIAVEFVADLMKPEGDSND